MTADYDDYLTPRHFAQTPAEHLIGLIRFAQSGVGDRRVEAASVLGYRRCAEAIPALVEMMREGGHAESVVAADALTKIGEPAVIPQIEQAYEECKAICEGAHLHWDADRLHGILTALLRFRGEPALKEMLRQGSQYEAHLAWRELSIRRAARLLREELSRQRNIRAAIVALCESGAVPTEFLSVAVEVVTGLPWEDSRYLVCLARKESD